MQSEIKDAVRDALIEFRELDSTEMHRNHHEFIELLIRREEERLERNKRIQERIAGSLILTLLAGLVTWLGSWFVAVAKSVITNWPSK